MILSISSKINNSGFYFELFSRQQCLLCVSVGASQAAGLGLWIRFQNKSVPVLILRSAIHVTGHEVLRTRKIHCLDHLLNLLCSIE